MTAPSIQPNAPFQGTPPSQVAEITVSRLAPDTKPLHWDNWEIQIKQMIPQMVSLKSHIIFDWNIDLTNHASAVDIYTYNIEKGTLIPTVRIENPDLSFSLIMELEVAKFDNAIASSLRDANSNGHRLVGIGPIVVYKNKQLQSPKMFGPTIDTLMMSAAIDQFVNLNGHNLNIAEVGIGNGMISKMMLHKFHPQLKRLWASDLSGVVLKEAVQNVRSLDLPNSEKEKLATLQHPSYLEDIKDGLFQLIVSNPPYIPDFSSAGTSLNQAITGLEVYSQILGDWGYHALSDEGRALMILSSVSAAQVRNMIESKGLFRESNTYACKLVPFDLREINDDKMYRDRLINEQKLIELGGRLFHLVEVVEFAKR